MLKHLLIASAMALSVLAGTAYAQPSVDDTCTRFLDNNTYSCWAACDNDESGEMCMVFDATSRGHFEAFIGGSLPVICSCDNRTANSGIQFNESHSFLCVLSTEIGGIAFNGTVNRSINFDGNFYFNFSEVGINCTVKCRLDPSCRPTL